MNVNMQETIPFRIEKVNADTLTPIGIFKALSGDKKVLLESSFDHGKKSKYSYIGADPYQEIIGVDDQTTVINHETGERHDFQEHALYYLKNNLPKLELDLPLPFTGGAIGYVGYDAIRSFEDVGVHLPDDLNMPDIHFMLYQNLIIYDHDKAEVTLVAINIDHLETKVLDQRIDLLKQSLHSNTDFTEVNTDHIEFTSKMTKETFEEKVRIAKDYIKQGVCSQIVVSKRMEAQIKGDPFSYYRKLRIANPSPYMFYLDFGDYLILGASPESLIQTAGEKLMTNPIAGTRPRGKTNKEDEALKADLLADKKEVAEHDMLVTLSQIDLERVCIRDSITTPIYKRVEMFQHVMHIVSEVHGTLKEDLTSIDALIACLPAGTISGTPKLKAMQIINELESIKRGFYGGGVGYIGFNHDVNLALAIRSLIIKDAIAYLQSGAGIVNDSDPETEYMETIHKARSLIEMHSNK